MVKLIGCLAFIVSYVIAGSFGFPAVVALTVIYGIGVTVCKNKR